MAVNRPSEAGVYAVVYIGGTEIKMLLDTGATVSLLSERDSGVCDCRMSFGTHHPFSFTLYVTKASNFKSWTLGGMLISICAVSVKLVNI